MASSPSCGCYKLKREGQLHRPEAKWSQKEELLLQEHGKPTLIDSFFT